MAGRALRLLPKKRRQAGNLCTRSTRSTTKNIAFSAYPISTTARKHSKNITMKNFYCLAPQRRATIRAGLGRPTKSGATVTRPLKKDSGFFYVPCCAGGMAHFLAGRVGTPKGVPVPDSGRPTLHGLSPSLGRGVDRFTACQSGVIMTDITTGTSAQKTTIVEALRAILAEVTPGQRPYSSDSYLPDHMVEAARAALALADQFDMAAQQHAFNALSTASWHAARGEPQLALSRIRRAQSHLAASMEVRA